MELSRTEGEEERKHTTVHLDAEEHKHYRHRSVEEGLRGVGPLFRAYARIADFVRPIFTREYIIGGYDRQDAEIVLHGGEPDRDWIERDVLSMAKDASLKEYQRYLLDTKKACEDVIRIAEYKEEIVDEELDKVEHLLEKAE